MTTSSTTANGTLKNGHVPTWQAYARATFVVPSVDAPLESRVTFPVDSEPDDAAVGVLFAAGDERALARA